MLWRMPADTHAQRIGTMKTALDDSRGSGRAPSSRLHDDGDAARHRAFEQRAHRLGRLVEAEGAVDMRPAKPRLAPTADALHQGEGAVGLLDTRIVRAPADIVAVVEAGHGDGLDQQDIGRDLRDGAAGETDRADAALDGHAAQRL